MSDRLRPRSALLLVLGLLITAMSAFGSTAPPDTTPQPNTC
ncbi:hypothetical protein AB0K12_25455 [Nonomuraea sp. NPDC049419]